MQQAHTHKAVTGCVEAKKLLSRRRQTIVAFAGVAAEYPQRTLAATPACSTHIGSGLCKTYEAGQKNLDVYTFLRGLVSL